MTVRLGHLGRGLCLQRTKFKSEDVSYLAKNVHKVNLIAGFHIYYLN